MSFILTLVSNHRIHQNIFKDIKNLNECLEITELGQNALDIRFSAKPDVNAIQRLAETHELDYALQPHEHRIKKLFLADMDSTIIQQECLDELAAFAGVGAEVAEVTEKAMEGKIDFESALKERVSKLATKPFSLCEDVLKYRISLSPAAETTIRTLEKFGTRTILVSGGFDVFVTEVARRCGFSGHYSNRLKVSEDGFLTGEVIFPILGRTAKADILRTEAEAMNISLDETASVGDGANDLEMIDAAGLGIAYRGKPVLREAADASINHTNLASILYFMGIPAAHFVT